MLLFFSILWINLYINTNNGRNIYYLFCSSIFCPFEIWVIQKISYFAVESCVHLKLDIKQIDTNSIPHLFYSRLFFCPYALKLEINMINKLILIIILWSIVHLINFIKIIKKKMKGKYNFRKYSQQQQHEIIFYYNVDHP